MLFSILEDDYSVYIFMHAELSFSTGIEPEIASSANYEEEGLTGFHKILLPLDVFEKIAKNIISLNPINKKIILDFHRIFLFAPDEKPNDYGYVFETLLENIKLNETDLYLVNIESNIYQSLTTFIANRTSNVNQKLSTKFLNIQYKNEIDLASGDLRNHIFITHRKNYDIEQVTSNIKNIEYIKNRMVVKTIRKCIKNICCPFNDEVRSSSKILRLNYYLDFKQIIENKNVIYFFSYLLVMQLLETTNICDLIRQPTKPVLFLQSMNGGALASCLSCLLDLDLFFIDHLGPNYMLNPTTNRIPFEDNNFIIVSDVICTASELDRAENLIEYNRGKILGNICLVNVGHFQPSKERFFVYLYDVMEDGNRINYSISIENTQN